MIRPAEYGVDLYGDTPFTINDLIRDDPGLVRKFVDATLAGWEYALENVCGSVDHTLIYVEDDVGIAEFGYRQRILQDPVQLVRPDLGAEIGQMSHDRWTESYELLQDYGIIDSELGVGEPYSMEFLN